MPLAEQSRAVASEIGDAHREWRALQFLGEFGIAGDIAEVALPWLEQALALARRDGFAAGEAISIHSLGVSAWIAGDLRRTDDLIAESIALFRSLEESTDTIPSPLNIAEIRMSQPDEQPGLRHLFEDTLQPFVEISCAAAASYALANQAAIARVRGDLVRAWALLNESEARFEAAGDEAGVSTVLVRRAYTSLAERDLAAAHAHLERALELRAGLGDRRGRGLVLSGLGLVETIAGDYDHAERHLAEARDIFRRAGDRWGLASTLWRTADLAIARERLDVAESALREALSVLGATQRERWLASTVAGLAEIAVLRGNTEEAAELLHDARERYASRDDALGVATIDERLRSLAKEPLRAGKGAPDTPVRQAKTKGRKS
jgi:tetratricopeptide (TPR) repeat protein